jgi:beta-glucanase (GH16 family)
MTTALRRVVVAALIAAPLLGVGVAGPAYAATTQTIKIDPKVLGHGTAPEPARAAGARLAVRVDCAESCARSYPVQVQRRPTGSTDPWRPHWSGDLRPGRSTVLRGRACCAYRMRHLADGRWSGWSRAATYRWRRTFIDEFSTGELDPARWQQRRPGQLNTASGGTCSRNSPAAVTHTAGTVRLSSVVDPDPQPPAGYTAAQRNLCEAEGWYLDAMIGTQGLHEARYGWYSARIRMARWPGAHTAFWLQHVGGYAAPGGEVDVAEHFGSTDLAGSRMWHNCYWNWDGGAMEEVKTSTSPEAAGLDVAAGERFWNTYNVYSLDWGPERMRFLVNGVVVRRVADPDFSGDAYLVLSAQARDYEIDRRVDGAAYTMDVDWVQAWQPR